MLAVLVNKPACLKVLT